MYSKVLPAFPKFVHNESVNLFSGGNKKDEVSTSITLRYFVVDC